METEYIAHRASQHGAALKRVAGALQAIEARGSPVDNWEADALLRAMNSVICGAYNLACQETANALTPPDQRSRRSVGAARMNLPSEHDIVALRRALAITKGAPTKEFVSFGGICTSHPRRP